jgi:hypothetical protein
MYKQKRKPSTAYYFHQWNRSHADDTKELLLGSKHSYSTVANTKRRKNSRKRFILCESN